jgi:hypothetical protein
MRLPAFRFLFLFSELCRVVLSEAKPTRLQRFDDAQRGHDALRLSPPYRIGFSNNSGASASRARRTLS